MPRVITSLCMREGGCVTVCPVDCIVPGNPVDKYPWYYIDGDTCIDCGACEAECPFGSIFPDVEVPYAYKAKGGERLSMPVGTEGFTEIYDGADRQGEAVHLEATRTLAAGEVVNLTFCQEKNDEYFKSGPGYGAN